MAPKIVFTPEKIVALRKTYDQAVKEDKSVFAFEGHDLLPAYAKYLLDYLESHMWQHRVLAATRGTKLGEIMARALGRADGYPRFAGHVTITSDRLMMCDFAPRDGEFHPGAFVGSVSDLETNVVGLAEHLSLSETERDELARHIRAWIGIDYSGQGFNFKWR